MLEDFGEGSAGDNFAATAAGAWTEVEDLVGAAHGFLVVLDDDERVAFFGEGLEGVEESFVVARVEADGGLVQNIQDSAKIRAELGGEADALGFAAGEGFRGAVEGEVVEAGEARAASEEEKGLLLKEMERLVGYTP